MCVLALVIVGVGMSTQAQSTHMEVHKREKPHLFAVGNSHSINIEVGTLARFIWLEQPSWKGLNWTTSTNKNRKGTQVGK